MAVLYVILFVLLAGVCLLLTVVVLFQDNRSGGLAGALGGGVPDSAFGAHTAEKMSRLTMYLAIAFFVLVILVGVTHRARSAMGGGIGPQVQEDAPAPDAPPAPAPSEAPAAVPAVPAPAAPASDGATP